MNEITKNLKELTVGELEDALETKRLLYKFYFTQHQIRQIFVYYLNNGDFIKNCPDDILKRHINFWKSGEIQFQMSHTYVNDLGQLRLPYFFESSAGKTLDCGSFGPIIIAAVLTQALTESGRWDAACNAGDEKFGKDNWKLNWYLGSAKKERLFRE
tara:strand:+ start:2958 stop:3428 length:471 start_codon:yes stop_codon:yes gene_type:complete